MSTIKVDTYLTRGGASEIAIDKLKGVSSASSISVVAEGGTNTTNLQQGLCKVWVGWNSSSIIDSFNISSVTDDATGAFTTVLVSNMANATYSESGIGRAYHINTHVDNAKSTTGDKHETFYVSGTGGQRTALDIVRAEVNYHGDLA